MLVQRFIVYATQVKSNLYVIGFTIFEKVLIKSMSYFCKNPLTTHLALCFSILSLVFILVTNTH